MKHPADERIDMNLFAPHKKSRSQAMRKKEIRTIRTIDKGTERKVFFLLTVIMLLVGLGYKISGL